VVGRGATPNRGERLTTDDANGHGGWYLSGAFRSLAPLTAIAVQADDIVNGQVTIGRLGTM
jgi:hypothetical protein